MCACSLGLRRGWDWCFSWAISAYCTSVSSAPQPSVSLDAHEGVSQCRSSAGLFCVAPCAGAAATVRHLVLAGLFAPLGVIAVVSLKGSPGLASHSLFAWRGLCLVAPPLGARAAGRLQNMFIRWRPGCIGISGVRFGCLPSPPPPEGLMHCWRLGTDGIFGGVRPT